MDWMLILMSKGSKLAVQADLIIAHAVNSVYNDFTIDVNNTSQLFKEIEQMFELQKSLFFDIPEVAEEIKRHKDDPVHLTQHITLACRYA